MEIQCSPKVRILQRQNSQTLWYLVKKPSEAGRSDCSFNKFFIRKFWLLYKHIYKCLLLLSRNQHRWSLSLKLNRIRFTPSLLLSLYSLKDVTVSVNGVAFTKFELLTSPSFEKIRILSILFLTTHRDPRKFPASTAVPVLAFPSSYPKVPIFKSRVLLFLYPFFYLMNELMNKLLKINLYT